jgi:GDP-L-fucose synthase
MINWKEKKVLVSGGNGFLGKFVVDILRKKGAKKIIIPSSQNCDLRKITNCQKIAKDCDIIIHLAAKAGGIGLNLKHSADLFYDNLIMGTHLMHAAYESKVQKFIGLGTICSYPKFAPIPFTEDSIWDGYPEETNAPYGLAKKMLLVQSQSYRKQYGFKSIIVIPTNLYGPEDNFDPSSSHVIPAIISKIHNANLSGSNSVSIWGDGTPSRDFLYVKDAARGIVLAAEKYDDPIPLNLGTGEELAIKELVFKIANLMRFKGKIIWDSTKPNGQPRRCVSFERAKKEIGFRPIVDIDEGLKETINWHIKKNQ